jgi:DNA-binding CsgD family transcriptional regulator
MLALSHQTRGVVAAAYGDHVAALEHFNTAIELTDEHITGPTYSFWWNSAIESAAALGQQELAQQLAARTVARGRAFGAPRTLGRILRASAKASSPREAEAMLVEAIDLLESHEGRYDLALAQADLAQLLAQQVRENPADLKRRARAIDLARRSLRMAQEIGARPTAERATDLLHDLGAKPGVAAAPVEAVLSPGEERVCRLAVRGLSNREIAEHLFITRKAVEWHLSRSYAKLQITSRAQLGDVLPSDDELVDVSG